MSRVQHQALFLSRTLLRILRTDGAIDPGTAFERPLAAAANAVLPLLPRKPSRPSYITIASHLSPATALLTYLNGQHRPPYRARVFVSVSRVCLSSCLVAVLVLFCRVSCHCRCYCLNDTQDHRPSHPYLRPLRLRRPQLKEQHPRYQIVPITASPAGCDNALPIQSTYLYFQPSPICRPAPSFPLWIPITTIPSASLASLIAPTLRSRRGLDRVNLLVINPSRHARSPYTCRIPQSWLL